MTDLQIKCFLQLAEKLNFTKAAEALSIAQSTLSAHISALEKDLDLILFTRTKRKVFLSPEGEIMLETFKNMNQKFEKGFEEAHQLHKNYEEKLTIGCMHGLELSIFLNNTIRKFRNDYPNVKIEVCRMENNALIEGLDSFNLDVVFTLNRVFDSRPDFNGKTVYESPLSIIALASRIKKKQGDLTIEDFRNEPFLVLSKTVDSTESRFLQSVCDKLNFKIKNMVEFNSVDSQILNVELGFGVALSNHVTHLYGDPQIIFFDLQNLTEKIVAVWKKNNPGTMISLFRKYL